MTHDPHPHPPSAPRLSGAVLLLGSVVAPVLGVALARDAEAAWIPPLAAGLAGALAAGAWWLLWHRPLASAHRRLHTETSRIRAVTGELTRATATDDDDPLAALLHHLGVHLDAVALLLAERDDDDLRTHSVWHRDGEAPPVDWRRGPWRSLLVGTSMVVADGRADGAIGADLGGGLCLGVPLDGRRGVLVVVFAQRPRLDRSIEEALRLAATRCTAELHRQHAELATARSLRLIDALFDNTRLLALLIERDRSGRGWRIARANRATAATLGFELADLLALAERPDAPLDERALGVELQALEASMPDRPLHAVMDQGLSIGGAEYLLRRRDGTTCRLMISATPMVDAHGRVEAALCFGQDLTERHALREQLRQSQKLDAVAQLAGGIAYDFNNMLASVMGYCEIMLLDDELDPGLRDAAEAVIRIVERAGELTRRLLTFSRGGEIQRIPVGLHRILDDAVNLLRHDEGPHVTLDIHADADRDELIGDPGLLTTSVCNVLRNAAEAMPAGDTIRVTTGVERMTLADRRRGAFDLDPGDHLTLTIADTGHGIAEEHLDRIFEPFFSTRQHDRGTGLGLATVHGAMEQHRGAVRVDTAPGVGTSVTLYLPLASSVELDRSSGAQIIPGTGMVLVIDDERPLLEVATQLLEHLGYRTIARNDPLAAIETFARCHDEIVLVILDMVMPAIHGREVLERLRRIDPSVKVLVASGFPRDTDPAHLRELGAAGYLQKPFRLRDLSRHLGEILGPEA